MDTLYFCCKVTERTDGTKNFVLSSAKESQTEAEAQVSKAIAADRKNEDILCSTNFVLASNGTVGLKKYFTHNVTFETPYFVEINLVRYTEESGKPLYKAYNEYDNEFDAETEFWNDKGNGMTTADVVELTTIVVNHHGGVEISDFWTNYPAPESEPEEE